MESVGLSGWVVKGYFKMRLEWFSRRLEMTSCGWGCILGTSKSKCDLVAPGSRNFSEREKID